MFSKTNTMSWKVKQWWETFGNSMQSKFQLRYSYVEIFAIIFVLISAGLTYLYGTFLIMPEIFASYPRILLLSLQLFTTWIVFGVYSNMYLVRKRNSSIRNRMLIQPIVKPMSPDLSNMDSEVQLREKAKHLGEHFRITPFGETQNWHICAMCEVFVPPRTWHCHVCRTCVLRRDHHCIFAACCIGEENHCNFMGLVFYLGLGSSMSAVFSLIYFVYFKEMTLLWYIFRCLVMIYTILFDFNVIHMLTTISTMGQACAWGVFGYYIFLALRAQTSADAHRKIIRTLPGRKLMSYDNMESFLGPNPILRILWPFHEPLKQNYGVPKLADEEFDRKGL